MLINETMEQLGMTKYRLAKKSGVPYATIGDICSGKAQLQKCAAETIYKIAKALDISMESLLEDSLVKRSSFELFKSHICHRVKSLGDINFIIETLEQDDISRYYGKKWYPECLYLLAMLDYISRLNQVPLCTRYDELRKCRLQETLYPAGVKATAAVTKSESPKKEALIESIPEFMRFNIVESKVRNVV